MIWKKRSPDKSSNRQLTAVAFVDFEHWYISLKQIYGLKPDIDSWVKELNQIYNLQEIYFFANFSYSGLRNELDQIRAVTHLVVDTQNAYSTNEKDFTDFIMLDYIYRESISHPEMDAYVLFTGDGHFLPVITYLKHSCKKRVDIYGVSQAISNRLKEIADSCVEIPSSQNFRIYQMIATNFQNIKDSPRIVHPTFRTTVDIVSRQNDVPPESVESALREMLMLGYVFQRERNISAFQKIRVIEPNYEAMKEAGIFA